MSELVSTEREIIRKIRQGLNWKGGIVSEFSSSLDSLPVIIVAVSGGGSGLTLSGSVREWDCIVEMRVDVGKLNMIEAHRDPNTAGTLANVVRNIRLDSAVLLKPEMSRGVERDEDNSGSVEYAWLRFDYDMYVNAPAAVEEPSFLPVLPSDLSDVWGIKAFLDEQILYLTEGSPTSQAEADIHSYDLSVSPPERRSEEVSAGVSSSDYRRGLDGFADFLYSVTDEGTRGTWALHKIDRKQNLQTARANLGAGNFTGCWVFANGTMVGVSEHHGGGTRYHIFNTSDLSPASTPTLDVQFGAAAGGVDIGQYAYDIVGSTAICIFGETLTRRFDLDIYLGGFRVQWRDLTRYGDKLIASGVESSPNGVRGVLEAFDIPAEILRAA